MTWSDLYLLCFLVGFSLSVLSFLAGAVHIHLPFKMHFPFHAASGNGGGAHATSAHGHSGHISWFNATTFMAFIAWFGGVGYILTTHSHLVALASLGFATLAGLFAGFTVFRFMTRLVRSSESEMNDWDYRMEGSVGTISMPIRQNGTGEVIFEQGGARRSLVARCEDGKMLAKGAEVVIERYDHGIAYVRPWDEFTK
jgi:membrane protein implicated in regulation of membrane protease activity